MSGGSFNYLCYAESYNINEKRKYISEMRDRLTELQYLDAAKETESLILLLDSFEVRLDARISRLKNVWKSVEWCDSGDIGLDDVKLAIEKYRSK